MGRDNQARHRQADKLARKEANKLSADRILIVSEGSKTEPNYFNEIREYFRLPTANITTLPSDGTSPIQVVKFAEDIFINGLPERKIQAKAFEKVFAVFDRDEHDSYGQALDLIADLNKKKFKNDVKTIAEFRFAASVPCFELWLLIHFKKLDSHLHLDCQGVYNQLKKHMPQYKKGSDRHFYKTKERLSDAITHAKYLSSNNTAWDDPRLYTNIHELVDLLSKLKQP